MQHKGSGEEGVGGDVAASEEPEALRGRLREAEEAVAVWEGAAAQLERQLAELRVDAEALRGRAGEAEGARVVAVEELETLKAHLGDTEGEAVALRMRLGETESARTAAVAEAEASAATFCERLRKAEGSHDAAM